MRELFSKFGVAGTLLDNVVKSISSDDETLLKFMRKVRVLLCIMLVVEQPLPATFLNRSPALAQVEFGGGRGQRPQPHPRPVGLRQVTPPPQQHLFQAYRGSIRLRLLCWTVDALVTRVRFAATSFSAPCPQSFPSRAPLIRGLPSSLLPFSAA